MQIFVEVSELRSINKNNKWTAINHIIPDNTIYNIKQIISNKFNIPIDSFYLMFGGRILDNNLSVKHYHITSESTLRFSSRFGTPVRLESFP